MKHEVIIELERTTIISNETAAAADGQDHEDDSIIVEAREIKKENLGLPPKRKRKKKHENKN